MGLFTGKFESAKQEWETPQALFDILDKEYHFTFDLAADSKNTKCKNFYSKEDNALEQSWSGVCWLNPPYGAKDSKLSLWVKKAFEESCRDNCMVVMLIPARTNTVWFHKYCLRAKEILFIEGRPKFGNAEHGLPQPLVIIVFDGENRKLSIKSLGLKDRRIKPVN